MLTVARNGAWGLSTARTQGEAIAGALRQCQGRSAEHSDCGPELIAYKSDGRSLSYVAIIVSWQRLMSGRRWKRLPVSALRRWDKYMAICRVAVTCSL